MATTFDGLLFLVVIVLIILHFLVVCILRRFVHIWDVLSETFWLLVLLGSPLTHIVIFLTTIRWGIVSQFILLSLLSTHWLSRGTCSLSLGVTCSLKAHLIILCWGLINGIAIHILRKTVDLGRTILSISLILLEKSGLFIILILFSWKLFKIWLVELLLRGHLVLW